MLLKIARFFIPEYIKKRKLNDLFQLTAQGFQSEIPEWSGLSYADGLIEYAYYTRGKAEQILAKDGMPEDRMNRIRGVRERLYRNALGWGQDLRKCLHIRTRKQAVDALELIYHLIGIDFCCCGSNEFMIKECSFSSYYSAEICEIISSLDEGLAAGISGGEKLEFTHRITDGCNCCKGYFGAGDYRFG